MILIYGLIMWNTGISYAFIPFISDYYVSSGITAELLPDVHVEAIRVLYNGCCCYSTNYLSRGVMWEVTHRLTRYANLRYVKERGRNITVTGPVQLIPVKGPVQLIPVTGPVQLIPVTGPVHLPNQQIGNCLLPVETRSNNLKLQYIFSRTLFTLGKDCLRRLSNVDQKQLISFRLCSIWESASLQEWLKNNNIQTVSSGLLSTYGSNFEGQWPNIEHMKNVSSELLPTWGSGSEEQWPNIDHIKNVSTKVLATWKGCSLKHLSSTYQIPNISSELLSTWEKGSVKQWSNMNGTFRLWESNSIDHNLNISFVSFSTWKNGSLDKWLNIGGKQPSTYSIFPTIEDIYFKNSYKRFCMEIYHDDTRRRRRTLQMDITELFDNNSYKDMGSNTSDVFQIFNQLEEEMQRKFNILHYTNCPYFLELLKIKYQRDNHLLSHKPDIISNQYWYVLSKLIHYTLLMCWVMLKPHYIYHLFHGHPWLQRKTYWFVFCLLTIRFNAFVYFPTVLLTIHQLRSQLLQTLCPVVSPAYKKMIYRRHSRYKRELIKTKIKVFFQFYVKWLKTFDLKEKYVKSANITDTCLKKKRRQYRGGRKRKCSFRKSGPFIYGKTLHKRHSLQKTTNLAHAFKLFMKTLQKGFNDAFISTHSSLTKAGEKVSDAANNFIDIFRLRRIPFQSHITVHPLQDPSMQNEFSRIATYATFPIDTPVSTLRLARAGFFYTGQSDAVECFHCHVQHRNWDRYDLPIEVHRRISPSCDFIKGDGTQNISIDRLSIQSGSYTSLTHSENSDNSILNGETSEELHTLSSVELYPSTCSEHSPAYPSTGPECPSDNQTSGSYRTPTSSSTESGGLEVLSYDSIGYSNQCSEQSLPTTTNQHSEYHKTAASAANRFEICEHFKGRNGSAKESELQNKQTHFKSTEIVKKPNSKTQNVATIKLKPLSECHDRPKHISYAVITVRMSSFKGWSSYTGQTPRELAAAGLFYAGYADVVACWFCGIRLQSWETQDDPWIEHAKWAPTCMFLRRSKGDEFIFLVHERNTLCSHSAEEGEKNNMHMTSVQYGPAETQTPLQLAASVEKVKAMGYPTGIIQKAIEKLQRDNIPIDTYNIVNELTGDDMSYFSRKPDPVKVSELTWNTTGQAHEVNPCSDDINGAMKKLDIRETNCLMEENKRLKNEMKCKICLDMDADITFVPCSHLVCCEGCGYVVAKCPVCRRAIEMRVKTRMS